MGGLLPVLNSIELDTLKSNSAKMLEHGFGSLKRLQDDLRRSLSADASSFLDFAEGDFFSAPGRSRFGKRPKTVLLSISWMP